MDKSQHFCRICGLYIETAPWGKDGKSPTYEICLCCGVEFGNEDYTMQSVQKFRKKWLEGGAQWFDRKEKPNNWSLEEQMKQIPVEFL